MQSLEKKFILSTLGIIVFVFLLSFVVPKVGISHNQQLLFGGSVFLCLLGYLVSVVYCGRKAKKMNIKNKSLFLIKVVYYGMIVSLLLNLPMILIMVTYLFKPELLYIFIGDGSGLEILLSWFVVPWVLFLIMMLIHVSISVFFLVKIYMMKVNDDIQA